MRRVIKYDAVLVPGGGVQSDGLVRPWVRRRLDRAVERLAECRYVITLSRGTTHKPPPLDAQGWPVTEAEAGARYLMSRGVGADRILTEVWSLDTIGNAYFSRVAHADPKAMSRLLVITSDFHMPRTKAVFDWIYGLSGGAYDLTYEPVEDVGLEPEVLTARRERERESLEALRAIIPSISILEALHDWLFLHHNAYSTVGRRSAAGRAAESY